MNHTQEDKRILDAFEAVYTPSYDASGDVLARIHAAPRGRKAVRVVVIAATTLCVSFALIGAAKLVGWQSFDFFGGRQEYRDNPLEQSAAAPTPAPADEDERDGAFLSEAAAGEARLVFNRKDLNGGAALGAVRTSDWGKILELVRNSGSSILMPAYIPAGYTLTEGVVEFYPDAGSLRAQLISSADKDGKTYEIYQLPAGYETNVCVLSLYYRDEDGDTLAYSARLTGALDADHTFGYGAPASAKSEKLNVAGFDEAMLITDEAKANGLLSIGALYKEISPRSAIDIFSLSPAFRQERIERMGEDRPGEVYSAVVYSIEAQNLGKEEITKIAQNMK